VRSIGTIDTHLLTAGFVTNTSHGYDNFGMFWIMFNFGAKSLHVNVN
jgi:hypothetical protein